MRQTIAIVFMAALGLIALSLHVQPEMPKPALTCQDADGKVYTKDTQEAALVYCYKP